MTLLFLFCEAAVHPYKYTTCNALMVAVVAASGS
jgi:hypothetical protein